MPKWESNEPQRERETVSPNGPANFDGDDVDPITREPISTQMVQHPRHYTQGIECWDYITSHNMGFLAGNVVKYVTRYKHKNGLEDLLKARQYLERLIKENGGTPLTEF